MSGSFPKIFSKNSEKSAAEKHVFSRGGENSPPPRGISVKNNVGSTRVKAQVARNSLLLGLVGGVRERERTILNSLHNGVLGSSF